jgi:hypothetical protein
MKGLSIVFVFAALLSGTAFIACSDNTTAESGKGTVETMTDTAAETALDRIRTPLEKAYAVKIQQEDRNRALEGRLGK